MHQALAKKGKSVPSNAKGHEQKKKTPKLGCRKWGCNKWGLKGCLAALPGNQPKSAFFALFLPFSHFSGGCEEHPGEIRVTEEKGLFPQISSVLLKPPSLKPPFAAPQPKNICIKNFRGTLAGGSRRGLRRPNSLCRCWFSQQNTVHKEFRGGGV